MMEWHENDSDYWADLSDGDALTGICYAELSKTETTFNAANLAYLYKNPKHANTNEAFIVQYDSYEEAKVDIERFVKEFML